MHLRQIDLPGGREQPPGTAREGKYDPSGIRKRGTARDRDDSALHRAMDPSAAPK